jgi:hypothetical protein
MSYAYLGWLLTRVLSLLGAVSREVTLFFAKEALPLLTELSLLFLFGRQHLNGVHLHGIGVPVSFLHVRAGSVGSLLPQIQFVGELSESIVMLDR